uniref:Enoyl reductase (ER) domain-containing protein n=1 Tax=Hemiselmis andersenii TaxID=464988 RepID=A0A6U4M0A2_HEMAN
MMKAIVHDVYGEAEVLQLREIPTPSPSETEVLVKVKAAGLHKGNWHMMSGIPYIMRLGTGLSGPSEKVMGNDISGVVHSVGSKVTKHKVGDEVFGVSKGLANGGWAEYAVCKCEDLVPKPRSVSWQDAAVVPTSAVTALEAVRDYGKVKHGQSVLILGASGGVGVYAVQFAKTFGGVVTGVCSAAKAGMVRSLGADKVIDYAAGPDVTALGVKYGVILDIAGDRTVQSLRGILTDEGTLVIVGGEGGNKVLPMGRQLYCAIVANFTKQGLKTFMSTPTEPLLEFIRGEMEGGRLKAGVEREFDLKDARKAMEEHTAGKIKGKVAIRVAM